jgi:transmembrane sensor
VRKSTSAEIDDLAAAWIARGDAGSLTPDEERELQAWLAEEPRHRGAYIRAQAIYIHTERASALGARFAANVAADVNTAPRRFPPVSRRNLIWGGGGAVAAAGLGIVAVTSFEVRATKYATMRGEIRTIPLADGSVMMMNTASAAAVRYTSRQREIELFEGEALFTVAKDAARPFRVISGATEVVALGTRFAVRNLKSEPTAVLVEEGIVDVVLKAGSEVRSAQLTPNMRAISVAHDAAARLVTTSIDPSVMESETAWRQGMLAFRGTTLADAVRQFDRYSESGILIADPAVGAIPITGLFSAYRPREFIETIAMSLNLRLDRDAAANRVVVRRIL